MADTRSSARGVVLDLHNHTRYSHDGVMSPLELLRAAVRRGVDCLGVTDHGTLRGGLEAAKLAASNPSFPLVIPGQEVLTRQGEVIGLYLTEEIAADLELEAAVAAIRRQGGIVYLPHPHDEIRTATIQAEAVERAARLADIIEVVNGRSLYRRFDSMALALATRYAKALGAGSDAHYAGEVGRAVMTVDRLPTRGDLLTILRRGRPLRPRTLSSDALDWWFFSRVGFDKARRAVHRRFSGSNSTPGGC